MEIKEIKTKSIITRSNLPEADFVINPYIGCQHSCLYCYADFMKRFTGHSSEAWGDFVDVKINSPETINLSKVTTEDLILIGSVTDPYQPLEKKYKLTRKCLEVLLKYQPRIEILTKSPLVLRDIDLFKKFKNLRVGISIGIFNERYARELEPNVASPQERIEILKNLSDSGIETYLFVSPIFPEISDFYNLVDKVKNWVGEIMFENLNIRANNRNRLLKFIERNKPELTAFYDKLSKNKDYWKKLEKEIKSYCEREKIKYKIFFNHGTRD